MELLLQIAKEDPDVIERPEPFVLFKGFGATSLDFELRAHLADILNSPVAQNRIRIEMVRRLTGAGIAVALPSGALIQFGPTEQLPKRRSSRKKA
jgi:small-conductance mechanosensitive channel